MKSIENYIKYVKGLNSRQKQINLNNYIIHYIPDNDMTIIMTYDYFDEDNEYVPCEFVNYYHGEPDKYNSIYYINEWLKKR